MGMNIDPKYQNTLAFQIAQKLDAKDGKQDGKIDASIWNEFVGNKGGKQIQNYITLENALKSITTYSVREAAKSEQSGGADKLAKNWLQNLLSNNKPNTVPETVSEDVTPQSEPIQDLNAQPKDNPEPKNIENPVVLQVEVEPSKEEPEQETNLDGNRYVGVQNADGTSYKIDVKEHTITKYDSQGNQIESRAMTDAEKALATNDLINQLQSPQQTNGDNQKIAPEIEKKENKNLTQEQIDEAVKNLKPGESYQYQSTIQGSGYYESKPITWTRKEDGKLVKSEPNLVGHKFKNLETVYNADRSKIESKDFITLFNSSNVITKISYDENQKPQSSTMNLQTENINSGTFTVGGALTVALKHTKQLGNNIASSTVTDTNGNEIVSYKDGKFYNAKGKEISEDRAYSLLAEANKQNNLGELQRTFAKDETVNESDTVSSEVKPFTKEQIAQIKVDGVPKFGYEITTNGIPVHSGITVDTVHNTNDIYTKLSEIKGPARTNALRLAEEQSINYTIYMDLAQKPEAELTDGEKKFMQQFEIDIAKTFKSAEE